MAHRRISVEAGHNSDSALSISPAVASKRCAVCLWQQICCALLHSRLQTLHHANIIFYLEKLSPLLLVSYSQNATPIATAVQKE